MSGVDVVVVELAGASVLLGAVVVLGGTVLPVVASIVVGLADGSADDPPHAAAMSESNTAEAVRMRRCLREAAVKRATT